MNASDVRQVLERAGIPYALIGGAAVTLRGYPMLTQDIAFLTTDRRVFGKESWNELIERGTVVDIRKGDFDDPLAGVVRVGSPPDQVDIVVGRWKWEQQAVEHAEPMDVFGGPTPVATRTDLILLKLAAGGYKDLVDATSLLAIEPREAAIAEIDSSIGQLPKDAQAEWARIVESFR